VTSWRQNASRKQGLLSFPPRAFPPLSHAPGGLFAAEGGMLARSIFAVVVLVTALTSPPLAIADECDARAADLVRESGATFVRRSTVKIFLQLEGFKNLAVECWPSPGVEADVSAGLPPDSFFDFLAHALTS
jgi:hypothetical protein